MNIFYLNYNPVICAQEHCDKHVVKMIVEYAQLLSTAHRVLDGIGYVELSANNRKVKRFKLDEPRESSLYKACHINHPSAVWTRSSNLPDRGWSDPPPAMPDKYKETDTIQSYRNYYIGEKVSFAKWKSPATIPEWFKTHAYV
jgi:hypothetical protein